MDLVDLVRALLSGDTLAARQWVADAQRAGLAWADVPRPDGLDAVGLAVAAGMAEMLAMRANQAPPAWVTDVACAPDVVYLVKAAESMPRLRRLCETEGSEPLRRRRILAPPDFLTAA
jgi:hypothetical protein